MLYTRPPKLYRFEGDAFQDGRVVVVPAAREGGGLWLPEGVPEEASEGGEVPGLDLIG